MLDDDNDNISVLDSSSSRGWRSILNIVRFLVGDGDGAASADNFFFRLRFHWCRHFILYLHPPKIIRIEVSSVSCFFFVVVALLWLRFLINSSVVTSDTVLISDGSALSATSISNTYPQRRGGHEPAYFRPNNVDFLQKSHLAIVFKISTIARRRCYYQIGCKTNDTTDAAAAASVAHCFSAIAKRHEGFPRNGTHDFVVVDVKSCIRYWDRCWMCPRKGWRKVVEGEKCSLQTEESFFIYNCFRYGKTYKMQGMNYRIQLYSFVID